MRALLTTDGSSEATAAMRAACRLLADTDARGPCPLRLPELRAPKSGKIARRVYQHRSAEETKRILEGAKQVSGGGGRGCLDALPDRIARQRHHARVRRIRRHGPRSQRQQCSVRGGFGSGGQPIGRACLGLRLGWSGTARRPAGSYPGSARRLRWLRTSSGRFGVAL